MLAALDAREFDGAQFIAALLIVSNNAGGACQCRIHRDMHHRTDEVEVSLVGRSRAAKITGLLNKCLVSADLLSKLLSEPVADFYLVEPYVSEGIAVHFFALGLEFCHYL